MKIAIVVAPYEICPPAAYGGVERVCSFWSRELMRQGHHVDLFAREGSTAGTRVFEWPHYGEEKKFAEWVYGQLDEDVDIIVDNTHEKWLRYFVPREKYVAMLHMEDAPAGCPNIVGCSKNNAWCNGSKEFVHLGCDMDEYRLETEKDDYLLYLGAIANHKQVHIAIKVARQLGIPIRVAGPRRQGYEGYFDYIVGLLQGEEYLGEVAGEVKQEVLGKAKALLWPINWDEPGGTIFFEAASCGTPVVAYRRGCAPELIDEGVTGFLVGNPLEMAEAVGKLDQIDPVACRQRIEERFNMEITVGKQLAIFERIINGETW
jgi:glycosyltransferase involved in cell wall biosynthesis